MKPFKSAILLSLWCGFYSPALVAEEDVSTKDPSQDQDVKPPKALATEEERYSFDGQTYIYRKPSVLDLFHKVPQDLYSYYDESFRWENWPWMAGIGASTAALIYFDQDILDESKRVGARYHISSEDKTTEFFNAFGVFPIRFPTDTGSAFYFIGDGWTHATIALSFYAGGYLTGNIRAIQTGMQIVEGIVSAGIVVQTLKHITGRESPVYATSDGGIWRFFPDQIDYHKHVSSYDAYPSGHMATAMVTMTVIAENYPEYFWIKPVGYTLMGLLGFQMMNNGVHWASDYPLAFALGYGFGHIAVREGRTLVQSEAEAKRPPTLWESIKIGPYIGIKESGLRATYKF